MKFKDEKQKKAHSVPAKIEEITYLLHTRGYATIENYLSSETTVDLRKRVHDAISEYRPVAGSIRSEHDQYHIHDLVCRHIEVASLLEDERLQQVVELLLGPYWIMYAFTSSSVPPAGNNYAGRIHVDSPRSSANFPFNAGVIWTLDDYTPESGAVVMLPGSQHSTSVPSDVLFARHAERIVCPAGSLIVFDARVYHRTESNRGENFRHALTMNACRSFMKQRMDWVRFVPDAISSQMNQQARRILGFDTRLPASLDEFFVADDQRLYKPGQG